MVDRLPQPRHLHRRRRVARNRKVHFYGQVDLELTYGLVRNRLTDFDRYSIAIERYLGAAAGNRAATWLDYTSPRVSAAHDPIDKVLNSYLSSRSG
jgi:hypothetical protein